MWILGDWGNLVDVKFLQQERKYKCKKAKVYNMDMISGIFVQGNHRCTICIVCVCVCNIIYVI